MYCVCPWQAVLKMSLNNTSQHGEAALPSLPPTGAVEQPLQHEGVHLEAAPQADSLNSPAPELIQPPPPPPPHEPHPSGPPGPEPKVPCTVSPATRTGPGPPACSLNCLSSHTCFPLALCMSCPHCATHCVPLDPREGVRHTSPHAPQWGVSEQGEDIHSQP